MSNETPAPAVAGRLDRQVRPAFRAERVQLVWVCSYYDGPLAGICRVNGELMRFERGYRAVKYRVFRLSAAQKALWLLRKWLFEACVGEHWSYPARANGAVFHWRRPALLHKAMFWAYYRARRLA